MAYQVQLPYFDEHTQAHDHFLQFSCLVSADTENCSLWPLRLFALLLPQRLLWRKECRQPMMPKRRWWWHWKEGKACKADQLHFRFSFTLLVVLLICIFAKCMLFNGKWLNHWCCQCALLTVPGLLKVSPSWDSQLICLWALTVSVWVNIASMLLSWSWGLLCFLVKYSVSVWVCLLGRPVLATLLLVPLG